MLKRFLLLALFCLGFFLLLGLMVVAAEDLPAPPRALPLLQISLAPAPHVMDGDKGQEVLPCMLAGENALLHQCPKAGKASHPLQITISYARQQYHVFHLPDKAG